MLTSNSDIIYFIQSKNSSNDVNWQLMLRDAANCSPVFSPKEGHFDTRHCPLSPEAWYPLQHLCQMKSSVPFATALYATHGAGLAACEAQTHTQRI